MDCFTSWSKFAFYGIPERPACRRPETVVFHKKAKFSDKSRHLSISRPKHVAGPIGDQSQSALSLPCEEGSKRGRQSAYCLNIPTPIWFISTRWLRNLASTCWSSTKRNFRGSFRDGGSVRTGRNSIWAESFIRSSQEKTLKLYSNLSKDLVGYGFFAALSKRAGLLLLPVLTRLFSEDEYGTFDLI